MQFIAPTLEYGWQLIAEVISEELSGIVYPPPATPMEMIIVQPGQMVVQVPV